MKTLSVRFYKRLILVVLLLAILIPLVAAITLKAQNSKLVAQLEGTGTVLPSGGDLTFRSEVTNYQEMYPELYSTAQIAEQRVWASNAAYLTFDCTPGENTRRILDVLDTYGIKATFFMRGVSDEAALEAMREVASRGHSVGLRSYSDSYQEIYQSVESYLEDFKKIYDLVYSTTGIRAEIFRFPGGSVNSYNSRIFRELIAEMTRRNFVFFDWHISGEDPLAESQTGDQIANQVLTGMEGQERGIIQLRDAADKSAVVDALPGIIEGLQANGYEFQLLTAAVMPLAWSYGNAS